MAPISKELWLTHGKDVVHYPEGLRIKYDDYIAFWVILDVTMLWQQSCDSFPAYDLPNSRVQSNRSRILKIAIDNRSLSKSIKGNNTDLLVAFVREIQDSGGGIYG